MMIKNSPHAIYSCLSLAFLTQTKCHSCQVFFTKADYTQKNYQLTFLEVLKVNQLNLEVVVQLTHQSCCPGCLNYLQDLYQTKLKTHD